MTEGGVPVPNGGSLPLSELPARIEDLELTGPSFYGYPPLQRRLAAKLGVAEERVVAAQGTSMANYLALAALLEPGDEVLIEEPTYEPLLAAAGHLGATVRRFPRRPEDGFRVDPAAVKAALTPGTRLVVVTNLHNPTSVLTDLETLTAVGDFARRVGARVLVDEVYLEALFEAALPSAARLGPDFVVTGSLTKAYGLGGLRCGWAVAEPDLARRMWRLNDLLGNVPAHAAERLSLLALEHLAAVAARARRLLDANRELLRRFLAGRPELEMVPSYHGTIAFPRLVRGDVDVLCEVLLERHQTTVVPGRFFGRPDHFRIGLGGPGEILAQGLGRLAAALEEAAR